MDEGALVVFGMGTLIAIVVIISTQWRSHKEAAYNARLKQMMIERGMSPTEITHVIQASPSRPRRKDLDQIIDRDPGV